MVLFSICLTYATVTFLYIQAEKASWALKALSLPEENRKWVTGDLSERKVKVRKRNAKISIIYHFILILIVHSTSYFIFR